MAIAKGILSKRALDVLNRASEIKSDIDYCGENGSLPKEKVHFMVWLGDHLRFELQREDWEEPIDADGDAVVGILEEYVMNAGQTLDEAKVRGALERADFIVAHNASADRPLLARHLPGTEKMKWLCSFRGIAWKQLLGIQSESLETLMGKAGLRYTQDHNAQADARDLKHLLATKHKGRTYLGRLLDSTQTEG